jgi:hypothetical protein
MIKKIVLLLTCLIMAGFSYAQEAQKGTWHLELRDLSLQLTNTDVNNAQYYQGYSNPRLTADSQTLIQGNFDLVSKYDREKLLWANNLLMQYGQITLKPVEGEKTKNTSVDKILFTTDYTHKLFKAEDFLGGFTFGPFLSAGYQTEFTKDDNTPRYKVLRGKAGLRLFEGKYLKDLYAATVVEYDFTYPEEVTKYAWEAGFRIEQPVNEKSKAIYTAMIRDFFHFSKENINNFSYELELDARLNTEIMKDLAIAPFINYYQGKGEYNDRTGTNLYVGVAISFKKVFF